MVMQALYTSVRSAPAQVSDESLVLACRGGDAEAWSMLIDRYQRLIYTIPRRAGLDEDQSADVFQRTFAKLLENLDRIRRPDCIHAWLVTTARRETLQLLRRQHLEPIFLYADYQLHGLQNEHIPDDNPLPNETLETLEEQHLIRMAMTEMDDRCRCLLTLLYYRPDSPSYAEVAAELDMPEGSLGPTRARCLGKLRRLLEQAGI
jgi:RNA polymerase sigma factor (sigma-70 family)